MDSSGGGGSGSGGGGSGSGGGGSGSGGGGSGSGSGSSWEDANGALADVIGTIGEDEIGEIWAAKGTYFPGDERSDSFQLRANVWIYGGFDGNETSRDQRDWVNNETILSGDINEPNDPNDNSYHVAAGANGAILDGFVITGGNANGSGSNLRGGGIYCYYVSPMISNCTITGNSGDSGGGMCNRVCNPTLTNCTITKNTGRGIHNDTSSPMISNCTIASNSGGGMYNIDSSPTISNCTFAENTGSAGGGIFNASSSPVLTNCTFSGNYSSNYGGGLYNIIESSPKVTNCIFWGNDAENSGDEIYNNSAEPNFSYCDIKGCGGSGPGWDPNFGSDGGGNIDSDPCFVDANSDNYHLPANSPCINTGDPNGNYTGQKDIDGQPRVMGGRVDMGGDEFYQDCVTIYVNADADGGNNGLSWYHAFTDLQDALDAADSGHEIWVAEGTYKPTSGTDRSISFELESGVALYGGFNGTEASRSQRDWDTHKTILTGDIGTEDNPDDNSYHVVVGASSATLDGFTVKDGTADNPVDYNYVGGGMYNYNCDPNVRNCTFTQNTAISGAGMGNLLSDPTIDNCIFKDNSASSQTYYTSGGGVYNNVSGPTIENCSFSGNTADYGGGMSNNSSSPTVTGCNFINNEAVYWGGGMDNYISSSPTITRCIFSGNAVTATDYGGGAIDCYSSSNANIVNCTISKNTAANGYAGGLYSDASSPTITSTIFWDNTDGDSDYDLAAASSGTITVSYSDVTSSYYYSGSGSVAGSYNISADPLFADSANNEFHLKSVGGRWNGSSWVKDNMKVSPCINTGDPSSNYSNEPIPNGSRINMGVYGNTSEASKSGYGSLCVTLTPSTAQWRSSSHPDTWYSSGYTLDGIFAYGDTYSYGIYFKEHPGYQTPPIMSPVYIYPEETTYKYKEYDPE